VKRLFAHWSQVTHLLVSRYPQDVTKRAMSPRSGFKAVGVIKVFITNSNLHDSLPRAAESKWKVLESCLHTSFDNSCVLASWGATLARVGRTGTHRMEVMSTNHVSQDLATAQAQAEASVNQAPASAAEVLNVAGGGLSDDGGAAKKPAAPVPPPASLSDTAVDIPVDRTRALYVFNARVANKAEGITSAKFELIVTSGANETQIVSLAPGEKYLNPTAKVGDTYVALCADTKTELARWHVAARKGYDKQRRSITGGEYVTRKWTDPEEQKVVLGEWTAWRRLLNPSALDYDTSHWDEPQDDPSTGKVASPFIERFLFYLVTRHQVLTCFFVGQGDSFSRRERLADLTNTVAWTLVLTVMLLTVNAYARVFVVALFMTPLSAVFQIASRIQCCGVEWGRVVTIPLWLTGVVTAIVVSVGNAHKPAFVTVTGSFFSSLAFQWIIARPGGIGFRVWLYGKGWNKRVGIGPKTKWFFDAAASGAGLG
jgi:hypothetical protein